MRVTSLTLIHKGEIYTLLLTRQPNGRGGSVFLDTQDPSSLVAKGTVVDINGHGKRRTWQVVSEHTGNAYGGSTLQKASTQIFYSEIAKWPVHAN